MANRDRKLDAGQVTEALQDALIEAGFRDPAVLSLPNWRSSLYGGLPAVFHAFPPTWLREQQKIRQKRVVTKLYVLPEAVDHSEEIRNLTRLSHPNIVRFYGEMTLEARVGGGKRNVAALVREWVPGQNISKFIASVGDSFALADYRRILARTAAALAYAHEKDVWHGSLKPENILVGDDGEVKVCDFAGPAGEIDEEYQAPEQRGGGRIDHRADIFSFGWIGTIAFARFLPSFMRQGGEAGHTDLVQKVLYVLGHACAPDPGERFQSARELADAFNAAFSKDPQVTLPSAHRAVGLTSGVGRGTPVDMGIEKGRREKAGDIGSEIDLGQEILRGPRDIFSTMEALNLIADAPASDPLDLLGIYESLVGDLSHRQVVPRFQEFLDRIQREAERKSGGHFGSFERNKEFVERLSRLLLALDVRLECPTCHRPATLRIENRKTQTGSFYFSHRTVDMRTSHGGKVALPPLKMILRENS